MSPFDERECTRLIRGNVPLYGMNIKIVEE